jgi:hypothetical protein
MNNGRMSRAADDWTSSGDGGGSFAYLSQVWQSDRLVTEKGISLLSRSVSLSIGNSINLLEGHQFVFSAQRKILTDVARQKPSAQARIPSDCFPSLIPNN